MKRLVTLAFLFLAIFVNAQTANDIRNIDGLVAWFSADSVHLTADKHVDTLYDKSGNERHAIQNTVANQPVFVENDEYINNQPTIYFDGDDYISVDFGLTYTQPNTVIVIWKENNGSGQKTCFSGLSDKARNQLYTQASITGIYSGIVLTSNKHHYPFDYSIFEAEFNTSNSRLIVNNNTIANGNNGFYSISGLSIGSNHGSEFINGNIAELICINGILSSADSTLIIDYLRSKYSPGVSFAGTILHQGNTNFHKPELHNYLWSDGCTDSIRSFSTNGIYSLTATDIFGLSSTDSLNVFFADIHSLPDTTICLGDTITWAPDMAGPYSYRWSDGSTGDRLKIANEGKYWVVITDTAGYEWHSDTVAVKVDSLPVFKLFDTEILSACKGEQLSSKHIDKNYLYEWNTGENAERINIENSGIYHLSITDLYGCMAADTCQVTVSGISPIAEFSCNTAIFDSATLFTNTSHVVDNSVIEKYCWNFGDNCFDSIANPSHTYANVGSYNVSLKVTTNNGCSNSFSTTATVKLNTEYKVNPITPVNGTTLYSCNTHFQWTPVKGCNCYHLQISADSSFNTLIVDTNVYRTDTAINLSNGNFYWRVRTYVGNYGAVSKFTISSISSIIGLVAWFSADSVHLSYDNHVDTLYDKSGNERHAIQNIVEKLPLWIKSDSSINYQPTLSFDGNDFFSVNFGQSYSQPNTVFVIWKENNGSGQKTCFSGLADNARNQLYSQASGTGLYSGAILSSNKIHYPFDYSIFEAEFNFSNSRLFVNNNIIAAGNDGSYTINGLSMGSNHGSEFVDGNISELIFINDSLSAIDSANIMNYLRNKYAPAVSLKEFYSSYGFKPMVFEKPWLTSLIWDDGCTDSIRVFSHSGFYKVTATDIFGFTSSDSAYISLVTPHSLPDTTICLGDTITWKPDLAGPYSYRWPDGSTGDRLKIANEGKYWVVITDTAGYEWHSDTVDVKVDMYANRVTLGNDTIPACVGNNIYLQTGFEETVEYLWSDGTTADHIAVKESGIYAVTTTDTIGCKARKSAYINVVGIAPTPDFTFSAPCATRAIDFTDKSHSNDNSAISSYEWTFGDGTTSNIANPTHIYKYSGNYSLQLAITCSNGCDNVLKQIVHIDSLPKADFSPTQCCSYTSTQFTDRSVTADSYISSWLWTMNDTTYTERNPLTTYNTYGEQAVSLSVTTAHGCTDTLERIVNVMQGPKVDFTYSPTCINTPVYFTNKTNVAFGLATNYTWTRDTTKFSSQKSPTATFSDTGSYIITLTVNQIANNCTSSVSKGINISPKPRPAIIASDICEGQATTLSGINNEPKSKPSAWIWNIDTLPTENGTLINHQFATTGKHKAVLTIVDSVGCTESFDTTINVHSTPVASFRALRARGPVPFDAEFINNSEEADNYIWHFGDGEQSTETDACHTYNYEDAYNVQLIARNDNCADTATRTVTAINPHSDITLVSASAETDNGFISVKAVIANRSNFDLADIDIEWYDNLGHHICETIADTIKESKILQYQFGANIGEAMPSRLEYICVAAQPSSRFIDEEPSDNEYCIILNNNEFTACTPKPNPANSKLEIGFIVPDDQDVKIELLDSKGEFISTLYDGPATTGFNSHIFNISRCSSGVYFYRISHNGQFKSQKIIISHD